MKQGQAPHVAVGRIWLQRDHARARDAVFTQVPTALVKKLGLIEIATRAGQDSDCNPSNAAGDTFAYDEAGTATKLDRDSVADGRQRLAASFAALGTRRLDLFGEETEETITRIYLHSILEDNPSIDPRQYKKQLAGKMPALPGSWAGFE